MDRGIENILDTGGRNLSPTDRQFVSTLFSELEQFQYQAPKDRALMFHPLGGYQRYLIHKVTEIFPKLTSFSIGDDQNRRTVVCFKSKRKEQQLQQMGPAASPVKAHTTGRPNEYGPSPTRSRESSRARNKQHDAPSSRPTSRHGKNPDQANYMPKPLRAKKRNSKVANSLPRSRSLHASPARQPVHDPYYSNDDSHVRERGRGDGTNPRKDFRRSSSVKNKAKSRSRPTSPESNRPKSATMTRSPTENSLKRRGQGLRLEGMVVNGDVEDPYKPDSEAENIRSDAEAIKRERSRKAKDNRAKSRRAKSEPEFSDKETLKSRRRRDPKRKGRPSESDDGEPLGTTGRPVNGHGKGERDSLRRRDSAGKRKNETPRNDRIRSTEDDDENPDRGSHWPKNRPVKARTQKRAPDTSSESDDSISRRRPGSISVSDDEIPPSYDKSSNMEPSVSKAKRNLNRIKRSDSLRSHSSNRSPSNTSARSDAAPTRARDHSPEFKSAATFPRQPPKKDAGSGDEVDGSTAVKKRQRSASSDNPPEYANISNKPRRKSTDKGKAKSRAAPANAQPTSSTALRPEDENIGVSEATLYTPLPDKLVKANVEPAPEREYVNQPREATPKQRQPHSSHSTLSSPITDGSQGFNTTSDSYRCDGVAQTEVTGTLTRKKASKGKASGPPSTSGSRGKPEPKQTPPEAAPIRPPETLNAPMTAAGTGNEKLMEEFCKVMLNFQKMFIASQATSTPQSEPGFPPHGTMSEPFHPFRSYYAGSDADSPASPVPPAALYNQFPPQVAHQLYLSWMAAYYAGATGSWPPPPPPLHSRVSSVQPQGSAPRYRVPPPSGPDGPCNHVGPDGALRENWDSWPSKNHSPEFHAAYYQPYSTPPFERRRDEFEDEPESHKKEYPSESDRFTSVSEAGVRPTKREGSVRDYPSRISTDDGRGSKGGSSSRHRSDSAAATDGADTDASSATSSSTHPEVAMKEGKSGVVVYVRSSSQSNSQANSTVSGGEDVTSLHSSSSHGLTLAAKIRPPSNGRANEHSRDGDDEETPDPDAVPPPRVPSPVEVALPKHDKRATPEARDPTDGDAERPMKISLDTVPLGVPAADSEPETMSDGGSRPESEEADKSHAMTEADVGSKYYDWTPNKEVYSKPPYSSIVEIHDFPPEFKDKDILKHFRKIKGFKLVWVDDTHALGMLPSEKAAKAALKLDVPMMRLRPLVHASSQSRKKAKIRIEEFGDYGFSSEPPPERSSVVAKKMVLSSLGLKESQKDKEKRAELDSRRQSKKKKT